MSPDQRLWSLPRSKWSVQEEEEDEVWVKMSSVCVNGAAVGRRKRIAWERSTRSSGERNYTARRSQRPIILS